MREGSRNEKSEQSVGNILLFLRERRVMGLLAVLRRVTQYASAVTSYLSV